MCAACNCGVEWNVQYYNIIVPEKQLTDQFIPPAPVDVVSVSLGYYADSIWADVKNTTTPEPWCCRDTSHYKPTSDSDEP